MVVVIQPRRGQTLGLMVIQRAEGHTGFEAHRLHALHHLLEIRHVTLVRVFPGRAHAEAGRAGVFRLTRRLQHLLHLHQAFGFEAGFVTRALRAVFAVFRAGPGLDRQQGTDLNLLRIEVLTVNLLRFKQQFKQGFFK